METEVVLSDGKPCRIRPLGIFELDNVAPSEKLGPYFYEFKLLDGSTAKAYYDLSALDAPPPIPTVPKEEAERGSQAYVAWIERETYEAAVAHQVNQNLVMERYNNAVLQYILDHGLANRSDSTRIVLPEDWQKVYEAALVPEVDEYILADVLERNFKAEYNGMGVLDALQHVDGGAGGYLAVKKWESELMLRLQLSEAEYSQIPVMERARQIVAMKMDDWFSVLESDRISKEMARKNARHSSKTPN